MPVVNNTILVTGGAGFIGSHLVVSLLNSGYKVVVFDNFSSGYLKNLPDDDVKIIKGDVRSWKAMQDALEGVDHVVHLAGFSDAEESLVNPRVAFETNCLGFTNLLDAVRAMGFYGRLIYASSADVYGSISKVAPITEEEAFKENPITPLAQTYQQMEQLANMYNKFFGIQTLGLRMFNVYGKGQAKPCVISKFISAINKKEPLQVFNDGSQSRDYVHVNDVVSSIKRSLKADYTGVLNIGTGESTTINLLIKKLSKIVGKNIETINMGSRPLDVKYLVPDITNFRSKLGLAKITTLEEGLKDMLNK